MSTMRVLLAGGGSGGHVFPAFAVADALVELGHEHGRSVAYRYVGTADGVEATLATEAGYDFSPIRARALRGRGRLQQLLAVGTIALGVLDALRLLRRFRPHAVLLTGGYVSAPVGVAAWLLRRPLALLQPDIVPGWTLRALAPLASRICVTHERSAARYTARKAIATGYPLRAGFLDLDESAARAHFGLSNDPVLLVTGSVRGAQRINDCVAGHLDELLDQTQLIHISGSDDFKRLSQLRSALPESQRGRYHLFAYLSDEMPLALAAADLVISRAGASVMAEYPAAAAPAILIPIDEAGGHQRANADLLAESGGAVVLENDRIESDLYERTRDLLANRDRLNQMRDAMIGLRRMDAARRVAQVLVDMAE